MHRWLCLMIVKVWPLCSSAFSGHIYIFFHVIPSRQSARECKASPLTRLCMCLVRLILMRFIASCLWSSGEEWEVVGGTDYSSLGSYLIVWLLCFSPCWTHFFFFRNVAAAWDLSKVNTADLTSGEAKKPIPIKRQLSKQTCCGPAVLYFAV